MMRVRRAVLRCLALEGLLTVLLLWGQPQPHRLAIASLAGDGDAVEIHVVVRDNNVTLRAPLEQRPTWIAKDFCERYGLEASVDGRDCTRAVEGELLLAYHKQEEEALAQAPVASSRGRHHFSLIHQQDLPPRLRHRPGRDALNASIEIIHRFFGAKGLNESLLHSHDHGMYIPLQRQRPQEDTFVAADVTLGEGGPVLHVEFLAPHAPVAVAQQLCLNLGLPCQGCPLESLQSQLERAAAVTTSFEVAPVLLSLDLNLEWSPTQPRRFVLYQGDDRRRRAASFCAVHRCPDRVNQVAQLVQMIDVYLQGEGEGGTSTCAGHHQLDLTPITPSGRVVVSLSTLPSRAQHVSARVLDMLTSQTRPPDHIYLVVPYHSMREHTDYLTPKLASSGKVTILRTPVDWGPATKLIPVLEVEADPMTAIITVDDDLIYPDTLVEDLARNSQRLPNAAVGFKGFRLPATPPYHHDRLHYIESCNETHDVLVDVLGGVTGVLYRSGFFDYDRLTDYLHHPSAGFYVDDEWIGAALAEADIPRVVLSRENAAHTSCRLFEDLRVMPYHEQGALNGLEQAPRNMMYQQMVLSYFIHQGALETTRSDSYSFVQDVFDPEYSTLLGRRANSLRHIFLWLESLRQTNKDYRYVLVETGTVGHQDAARWGYSGQATLLFDRFLNFYDGILYTVSAYPYITAINTTPGLLNSWRRDGSFHVIGCLKVDLDEQACEVSRRLTSGRSRVVHSDSVEFLWGLDLERGVDLVYLDSYDIQDWVTPGAPDEELSAIHHLKELAAILPKTRAQETGGGAGTMVVVDDNEVGADGKVVRGKGRLIQQMLDQVPGCQSVFQGWLMGWLCGGGGLAPWSGPPVAHEQMQVLLSVIGMRSSCTHLCDPFWGYLPESLLYTMYGNKAMGTDTHLR